MRVKTWQFTLDDAIWTVALDLVRSLTVRLLRNGEQTDVLRFPFTAKRLEFAVGEKSAFIAGEREGRRRTLHLHIDGQHMPSKATVRIGAADLFWRPICLLEVADRVLLFGGMSAAAVCLVQTLALTHWAGAGALAQGAVWLALFFGILVRNSRLAACLGLVLPLLEFAIIFAAPDMVDGAALAGV